MSTPPPAPEHIRARLAFDVQRLSGAAQRLEAVDRSLVKLRAELGERARRLADSAKTDNGPELFGDGKSAFGYAKAQAIAELAKRSALGEVLRHEQRLSLIAAMAISRWIAALEVLQKGPVLEVVIKGHVDAGRIAHRMLRTLKPRAGLKSGCGQLTAAIVVAEFVHAAQAACVAEQIEEGLYRGRKAAGIDNDDQVIAAASAALRAGAELLVQMAETSEPAARDLLARAEVVEAAVEADLLQNRAG